MKKYLILAGSFYESTLPVFQSVNAEFYFVLHEKNPQLINREYLSEFKNYKIEIVKSETEIIRLFNAFQPDFIFSMGWRYVLSEKFFNVVNSTSIINFHPAILPDYKGFHTEPYVIMNNEKQHGITAHLMTQNLDSGDILLQEKFSINEYSTVKSIKQKVKVLYPEFLKKLMTMTENESIQSIPQNGETKLIAPKRTLADSELNAQKSLEELYNQIRACDADDYPAFFYRNGEKIFVKIWTERSDKEPFEL